MQHGKQTIPHSHKPTAVASACGEQPAPRGLRHPTGALCLWGLLLLWAPAVSSQPLAGREVIERLVRVEEGQKHLGQGIQQLGERFSRIEEGHKQLEQRLTRVEEGQKQLGERLTRLEEGQKQLEQRLTRLEEQQKSLEQRVEEGFAVVDRRIAELREFLLWGFGVTFAGMFALVGFVLWDRRTALAPAVRHLHELQEREQRLVAALREYAATSPELAESLRKMGLL